MTVHKIAALAGVSIGTVDRVLHSRGRVSEATRAKVEAIIKQHGFIPNPIARRLKRNRPYRFCALIPRRDQDAGYWGQIIAGIERAASEIKPLGVETKIVEFDRYDPAAFEKTSDVVSARKPDGLLFAPIMQKRTRPFVEMVCDEKIPLVFVDADMPGTMPLCVIGQDSFNGGYLAGRLFHLFSGPSRESQMPAAVLDAHGDDYNITRRREGFLNYANENNIPVIVREYSDYDGGDISAKEIARFLNEHRQLSGIFITNCMAHRVAEAVKKRKKFLLVGYDLIPANRLLLLQGRINAIISQRPEEQGREALSTLFRSVVLEQAVEAKREIPLDVYIRENTPSKD
jgi:LacI family transcriptional regulator